MSIHVSLLTIPVPLAQFAPAAGEKKKKKLIQPLQTINSAIINM